MKHSHGPARHLAQPGRGEAAARARAWTTDQAKRLGISEEAIETAVKRGWTPDLLDEVQDPAERSAAARSRPIGRPAAADMNPTGQVCAAQAGVCPQRTK